MPKDYFSPCVSGSVRSMSPVEIVHWNPLTPRRGGLRGRLLPKVRVNNFGDLLGLHIVKRVREELNISGQPRVERHRLLAVGSILHMAREGDVVWGAGVNGKEFDSLYAKNLDVRSVRGPLTRNYLRDLGHEVPAIYGDPGLLVSRYWQRNDLARGFRPQSSIEIPNLNDFRVDSSRRDLINPRSTLQSVLGSIAASDFVCGSSLHAIIVAESLGIPARLIRSKVEPMFKYEDYFLGSGRSGAQPAENAAEAREMGGEEPPIWNAEVLLDAFPRDLWDDSLRADSR
jgi:pyruvyltransferase